MQTIHELDQLLINQIAAGEVIERPASVVKELIENAIDAQATEIQVELEEGGLQSIIITDNGKGMHPDDLAICTKRHTTSKLRTTEDLFSITSLGFRGEALASIGSVAKLSITSRQKDATGYVFENNQTTKTSCNKGTSIIVKDLFYNTPARKKYMKTTNTEMRRCHELVQSYALMHPHIGFTFSHNRMELLNTPQTTLFDRLVAILGKDIGRELIALEGNNQNIQVEGYIGKPTIARKDKRLQYFFVNKRLISSPTLQAALQRGFSETLHHGFYPIAVINITISTKDIDVNVHPTKKEIRFEQEQEVFRAVFHTVKETLQTNNLIRDIDLSQQATLAPEQVKTGDRTVYKIPETSKQQLFDKPTTQTKESAKIPSFNVLGLIHKKIIIAESKEGLILIDFHAAHERINYERLKRKYEQQQVQVQSLVSPAVKEISDYQMSMYQEHKKLLEDFGCDIEEFGPNTIIIRKLPIVVGRQLEPESIVELLEYLHEHKKDPLNKLKDDLIARMACRMSFMAGDDLSLVQMKNIIEDLHELEIAFSCPHGRPIMLQLTDKHLDKLFERTL